MPRKGFYTGGDYYGLVHGEYQRFPTEAEYIETIQELESEVNRNMVAGGENRGA